MTAAILASCARLSATAATTNASAVAENIDPAQVREVRYLSVLEGGYDIPAIQRSAVCHVEEMLRGLPHLPVTSSTTTITSDAVATVSSKAGHEELECPDNSSTVIDEGPHAPVVKEDGELLALREYLEAFGIEDTKP